jgi:hypothetical protein
MNNRFLKQFEGTGHEDKRVKILGVRGFYDGLGARDTNDLGIYDDLIVACIGDNTMGFRASTDPGWYYIKHPMNSRGCAILTEGLHLYKIGTHDNGKYPAFVQAESFVVWRLDEQGNKKEKGTASDIHIHSGGPGMAVEKFSAGCQVIQSPEGYFGETWLKFFNPLVDAMRTHGQTTVPYRLMRAEDLS